MARLIVEDAVLATGRSPETIERWILEGKVDAERSGDEWVIDLSSLLNVAASEEASGNGHHAKEAVSPVDKSDELGGRVGSIAAAAEATRFAVPPPPLPPAPPMDEAAAQVVSEIASALAIAVAEPPAHTPEPPRTDGTVEVASTAIAALSARLEQAMGEIDRLQDERLKLALQLGYAQSQLKFAQEQLKMLMPPASEPGILQRFWSRLFG